MGPVPRGVWPHGSRVEKGVGTCCIKAFKVLDSETSRYVNIHMPQASYSLTEPDAGDYVETKPVR